MGTYKISDLEKLSGVKAHTIRVWEQRYEILTPLRTETNIRYYNDRQLRKFLNVVSLINAGNKISSIGKLSEVDFNTRINKLLNSKNSELKEEIIINQLISSGLSYDEVSFEKAFSRAVLSFGLIGTYQKVLYPMLLKIGYLWTMSELTVSQEHFVTSLVKQKILTAIDSLTLPTKPLYQWVLFLPEGEIHEIGLLIASYALRKNGVKVIYLGKDVLKTDLFSAADSNSFTHFLFFVVKQNQDKVVNSYLNEMNKRYKNASCLICCSNSYLDKINLHQNQRIISDFDQFLILIK
ncbi:MAG: MerR family transcriptional regulator [Vicingaceae bacterium]|nr:MerR family transcriptional regulator [Vicingaceae bacterium]